MASSPVAGFSPQPVLSPEACLRQEQLSAVGKAKHPHRWNAEVVRALSTRLPYGRTALTAKCDVCHSAFFPCPCDSVKKPQDQVHAPRIVEEMERRIRTGMCMGSLSWTKKHTFNHGMDRTRLLVQGGLETKSYSIISRQGSRYVVSLDGEKDWRQTISVNREEVEALIRNLKDGPAGPKRKFLSPREEVSVRLTVRGGQELLPGRRLAAEYGAESVALNDLALLPVPRVPAASPGGQQDEPSSQTGFMFFVQSVKHGGVAYAAGVKPGHLLVRLKTENSKRNFDYIEPDVDLLEPFFKPEGDKAVSKQTAILAKYSRPRARMLSFPCALEFCPLPEGWTVDAVEDKSGARQLNSFSELEQICNDLVNPRQIVALSFVRKPIAVITRSDEQRVRHEHIWEREFTRSHHDISHEDLSMLIEWGVKSRLTHSQLEYTCKKLISSLSAELQEFEQGRKHQEQQLVQKAQRCVKIQMDTYKDEKERARVLDLVRRDLRALLSQCPLYFLYEVREGCRRDADPATPKSPQSAMKRMGHHGGEGGAVHTEHSQATRTRLISHIDRRMSSAATLIGRRSLSKSRVLPVGDADLERHKDLESRVLAELVTTIDEELRHSESNAAKFEAPEERLVPGRIKVQWNASGTQYQRDYPGRNDGRLSFEEFTKVLHSAGISWLTRDELQANFDVIDVDKSGYLSLGEVLRVSERMVQRIRQLREYEASLTERDVKLGHSVRKLTFAELIEKFVRDTCPDLLANNPTESFAGSPTVTKKFADQDRTQHPGLMHIEVTKPPVERSQSLGSTLGSTAPLLLPPGTVERRATGPV